MLNNIKRKIILKLLFSLPENDRDALLITINNQYLNRVKKDSVSWRITDEFHFIAKGDMAKLLFDTVDNMEKFKLAQVDLEDYR